MDTPQIGWNGKLKDWMVWNGMYSIMFHSTPFFFCKSKQWNLITYHSTPFHSITYHQSKQSLMFLTLSLTFQFTFAGKSNRRRVPVSPEFNHFTLNQTYFTQKSFYKELISCVHVKTPTFYSVESW